MIKNTEKKFQKSLVLFPYILVFYEMIHYLANDMYLPVLPVLAQELRISMHAAQMTITAWFLGAASMQLILGPLSDRVGRRPVLLGGGIFFILSTLYCGITSDIHFFLFARFLQGCAACAIGTAGYSTIHECFEQRDAIRLLAVMGSVTILSPAFGPLAGSALSHFLNWRWIFGALGILAVVGWILLWWQMPESNPPGQRHPLSWKKVGQNYFAILANHHFILNVLIFCFTFLAMIAWISAGPFLVIDQFKFSPLVFSILQAMVFGGLIVGSQIVSHWASKVSPSQLIHLGLLFLLIGGVIAFVLTWIFPHFIFGLIFPFMLYTFGASLAFGSTQRLAIEACAEPMGAKMAVLTTLTSLFGFIGGAMVAVNYSGTLFWIGSLLLGTAIAACGARILEQYINRNEVRK